MKKEHSLPVAETAIAMHTADYWHEFASQVGSDGRKSLEMEVLGGRFRVRCNGNEIYIGYKGTDAVEAYNTAFASLESKSSTSPHSSAE